ncbi:MAG: VCBS repeat-containing protein [candidate division WOR-3 bacterium]
MIWLFLFSISYRESSSGLENPEMEEGRTVLEIGDVNGDGNPDIVSVGDHGSPYVNTSEHGIMVWFGNGSGSWSVYQNGDFGYGGVALGDMNNDGFLDVCYGVHHNYSGTDFGDQLIEAAIGDGTGQNWIPWDDGLASEGQDWGMFDTDLGDLNNDGWLDIVSNSFGADDGVWAYLNNRDGSWTSSWGFLGGNSTDDVFLGDVNRDGFLDVAVAHQGGTIYLGTGSGGFSLDDDGLPAGGSLGRPGISLGDVDNDGGDDLAFINSSGGLEVWVYNEGTGSWVDFSGSLPATGSWEFTQLRDMDCDGNVDLLAAGDSTIAVYLGNGAGVWNPATSFKIDSCIGFNAFRAGADADHNGFPDIYLVYEREKDQWSSVNTPACYLEESSPTELRVFPVYPRGGERFYGGGVRFIDWYCAVPYGAATVSLAISTSGPGGPWTNIATGLPNSGRFQWRVPQTPSSNCYIRYIATSGPSADTTITPRPFEIIGVGEEEPTREKANQLLISVFGHTALIRLNLVASLDITLSVYDARGSLVKLLAIGMLPAGEHEFFWRPGKSGAYFVLAESGRWRASSKLVIPE